MMVSSGTNLVSDPESMLAKNDKQTDINTEDNFKIKNKNSEFKKTSLVGIAPQKNDSEMMPSVINPNVVSPEVENIDCEQQPNKN